MKWTMTRNDLMEKDGKVFVARIRRNICMFFVSTTCELVTYVNAARINGAEKRSNDMK